MSRVKIEDLKPEAKKLDAKEMKKLFGGILNDGNIMSANLSLTGASMFKGTVACDGDSLNTILGTTMGKF